MNCQLETCGIPSQGLFARRRQLLLTEGPHLYYVDPVNKVLKGEIPWSLELRPEAKNFKTFFVHTVHDCFFLTSVQHIFLHVVTCPSSRLFFSLVLSLFLLLIHILNFLWCLQPNRTYYLMDPSGNADRWCKKIQEVWRKIYQRHQNPGL